jgi:hypothetical protein
MIWWHERVLRHTLRRNTMISVPMWDRAAKGVLVSCSCGKTWAR